jgi:hypothetical protein
MTDEVEISGELEDRLDDHLEENESYEEFIVTLVSIDETNGVFLLNVLVSRLYTRIFESQTPG